MATGPQVTNVVFGEVWGTPVQDVLNSNDRNFRPTDAIVGEDGALYVADWQKRHYRTYAA